MASSYIHWTIFKVVCHLTTCSIIITITFKIINLSFFLAAIKPSPASGERRPKFLHMGIIFKFVPVAIQMHIYIMYGLYFSVLLSAKYLWEKKHFLLSTCPQELYITKLTTTQSFLPFFCLGRWKHVGLRVYFVCDGSHWNSKKALSKSIFIPEVLVAKTYINKVFKRCNYKA